MIESRGMYVNASERLAFESLRVSANAENTRYYLGTDFSTSFPLEQGQTVNVSYDTFVELDGADPLIIFRGKKYPRGFREGLQSALTVEQMAAVNSGITAEKVEEYDALSETKLDKADVLKRMAAEPTGLNADNVVPTLSKVLQMLTPYIKANSIYTTLDGYQLKLTEAQLAAVNSGINEAKVAGYNSSKKKVDASCTANISVPLRDKYCISVSGDPAAVTRLRTENNVGGILALTSGLFRIKSDCFMSIFDAYDVNAYDYYFAFHADGAWLLTKKFVPNTQTSVGVDDIPYDTEESQSNESGSNEGGNSEQSEEEIEEQQPTTDSVNGVTVQNGTSLDHYSGHPLCCIVAARKDRQNLTAADIEALAANNVTIKISANKTQDLDVMTEQFNPHPWEVKSFDTRAELSAEFEVFPTFGQGETESADGYPVGYDHYFAITINNTNGNEIYNFRRCAFDANENAETNYIRVIYDAPNAYNQDFYVPINSEIEVLEGEQAMAYINTYPEDADEKDVIVSIQNGCIIYASMDAVELAPEETEIEPHYISGGATGTVDSSDIPIEEG